MGPTGPMGPMGPGPMGPGGSGGGGIISQVSGPKQAQECFQRDFVNLTSTHKIYNILLTLCGRSGSK